MRVSQYFLFLKSKNIRINLIKLQFSWLNRNFPVVSRASNLALQLLGITICDRYSHIDSGQNPTDGGDYTGDTEVVNGNFRILKCRYVSTIFLAIFSGDIPLQWPLRLWSTSSSPLLSWMPFASSWYRAWCVTASMWTSRVTWEDEKRIFMGIYKGIIVTT